MLSEMYSTRCHNLHVRAALQRCSASALQQGAAKLSLRKGRAGDLARMRSAVIRERMNPLGLDASRFTVAERGGELAGFVQLEPKPSADRPQYLELRTLIVEPPFRGQGVGTSLVRQVLASAPAGLDILLTTLAKSIPFYQPHGFTEVQGKEIPRELCFEVAAGTIVARLVAGSRLVVLKRSGKTAS